MSKRKSYEEIKNYIEVKSNSGCKLISIDYNNKLKIECKCGEPFYVTFNNFKYKNQRCCKKCNGIIEWNIDNITLLSNNLGFDLVNYKKIKNNKILFLKDKVGYYYKSLLCNLSRNVLPDKFNKSNPYTIQNIKLWCKLNNKPFELLSDKYKGNSKKLKWKCLKPGCGEIFEMTWRDIFNNYNCPYCAGKQVGLSNCLATKNPELASEWHPTKNGDLTPYNVTMSNTKNIWWQCSKNPKHEWSTTVNNRNHETGCPYCSGRLPSEDYNLLFDNPELCKEWNYNKNNKKPEEYTPYSQQKIWWICKDCGHEWLALIQSRNGKLKTGCPKCNESKGEKLINNILSKYFIEINEKEFNVLNENKIYYYISQKSFNGLVGLKNGLLSYDFYIPSYNLLIEYQGEQHERYIPGFHKSKKDFLKQQEHDKRKKEYAQNNNINFLEIWYWDYDRIEEILEKELNS